MRGEEVDVYPKLEFVNLLCYAVLTLPFELISENLDCFSVQMFMLGYFFEQLNREVSGLPISST